MAGRSDLDVRKIVSPEQTVLVLTEHSGQGDTLRQYLVHQGFAVYVLSLDNTADWSPHWLASPPCQPEPSYPAGRRPDPTH